MDEDEGTSEGPDAGPLEWRRLRLLLRQLAAEHEKEFGTDRGWPAVAAQRTGLSKSYVRKLARGERGGIAAKSIDTVCTKMRIDRLFFTDEGLGEEPRYIDFVRKSRPADPVWLTFETTYPRFDLLSANQIRQLEQMEFSGGKPTSPHVYRAMADWMLDGGAEPSRPEAAERAREEGVRQVGRRFRKKPD